MLAPLPVRPLMLEVGHAGLRKKVKLKDEVLSKVGAGPCPWDGQCFLPYMYSYCELHSTAVQYDE